MRSEKEIEDKISVLRASEPSYGGLVAIMVLKWVLGEEIGTVPRG